MATFAFTSQDTIVFNDRVLKDLADGDCCTITFPNQTMSVKIGKNGNAIYGQNATGQLAEVKYRVLRGSSDDKFFNGVLANQRISPETFVLCTGELVKNIGNGAGASAGDTTVLSGGVSTKNVDTKSNVEGDPTQAVAEYTFQFAAAPRVIT